MATLRALLAVLIIPLAGLVVPFAVFRDVSMKSNTGLLDGALYCALATPGVGAATEGCATLNSYTYYALLCIGAIVFGLLLIAIFKAASLFTGSNRFLLSIVFPALTFVGLLSLGVLVGAQMWILGWGIELGESFWLDRVHMLLIWFFYAMAGLFALGIFASSFKVFGKASSAAIGAPISRIEHPRLALLVQQVGRAVGARQPDNIVLGLDANFFVTTCKVNVPTQRQPLKGQTLYLSLPLMRVLSLGELKAVIGHELAHFTGGDTAYSRRFSPIYRGLLNVSESVDEQKEQKNILLLPARLLIRFMIACFSHNERRASRKRELRADGFAVQAASAEEFGFSLIKASILSHLWRHELEETLHEVQKGKFRRNMSRNFEERLRFDVSRDKIAPLVALALAEETPHPTDTHPPTEERLAEAGLEVSKVTNPDKILEKFFSQTPAILALDNVEHIEELLTQVYHQLFMAPGQGPQLTDEERNDRVFTSLLNTFLAHMVVADGRVDEREVEVAEAEAVQRIANFDRRDFRDRCRAPGDLLELPKAVEMAAIMLTPTGFDMMIDLLTKIARADGELHERETAILAQIQAVKDTLTSEASAA